jgi:hypothetical protein
MFNSTPLKISVAAGSTVGGCRRKERDRLQLSSDPFFPFACN